jgi:SCP-2 sterol transfer family
VTVSFAPSVAALCDALTAAADRLSAIMRQVTDPSLRAVGTWTIGETAQHVSGAPGYFLAAARGQAELRRLDAADAGNAHDLAVNPERNPQILADRLGAGEQALAAYARQADGDPLVCPYAGVEVPLSTLLGVVLGELLVHGFDIARAAGLPWHIERAHAVLVVQAGLPLLPYTLDKDRAAGVRLAIDLRLRAVAPFIVRVHHGALTVEPHHGQRVDCHISADPAVYLLLAFNRIGSVKPMLRGQLVTWGPRPWRVNDLQALLKT